MSQIGADDERIRALIDAAEPALTAVYPARVEGTQIAHLCRRAGHGDDGQVVMRAICPGGARITRPLEPIEAGSVFIWCPSCRAWARAAGLRLPRSR